MSEIFQIIKAVNNLKDKFEILNRKVDRLIKEPEMIKLKGHVDQATACKLLHISTSKLRAIRNAGEIAYTTFHRKNLYPVSGINDFLKRHTIKRVTKIDKHNMPILTAISRTSAYLEQNSTDYL